MTLVTFNDLPSIVKAIAEQLDRIEKQLSKNEPPVQTINKKYNLHEAASYCRMADSTFRTYIYQRRVAGTKFGKAWIFTQQDLDQFIADFRRPTKSELKIEAFNKLNG